MDQLSQNSGLQVKMKNQDVQPPQDIIVGGGIILYNGYKVSASQKLNSEGQPYVHVDGIIKHEKYIHIGTGIGFRPVRDFEPVKDKDKVDLEKMLKSTGFIGEFRYD